MKEKNYTRRCSKANNAASLLVILIFAVSFAQSCHAQESGISQIDSIKIRIEPSGFAYVEEDLEVNNTIATVLIPKSAQDIAIIDSAGNTLRYDTDPLGEDQLLTFYLRSPDKRQVNLRYATLDLTGKQASVWTFRFSTSSMPGRTIVQVDFPEGSDVLDLRPTEILRSPRNLSTSMLLYPQEKSFEFEFDYRVGQTNGDGQAEMPYLYIIAALVGFILAGSAYALYRRNKRRDPRKGTAGQETINHLAEGDRLGGSSISMEEITLGIEVNGRKIKSSVLNMLEENEKRVVEVMENLEDEITQAYVYKTTGIPKATLSDVIKRLESRNIIEKRKDGRTNWIKLQKWVFSE